MLDLLRLLFLLLVFGSLPIILELTHFSWKELTKLSFENLQFMTLAENESKTNKVFMTCRTHYFFTNEQEQGILCADKTISQSKDVLA